MTRPGRACAALEQSKISRKPSQALPTRQTLVDLIAIDRATHQPQLVIFGVWLDARGPARRDQRRLPSHRRARPRSRLINEVEEPAPPLDLAHHSCVRPRRGHPHRRPRRQLARARCPGRQGPQLGQVARVHQRRMPAMGSGEDEPRVETPWQALGAGGHPHRPVVPGDPVPRGARSDPAPSTRRDSGATQRCPGQPIERAVACQWSPVVAQVLPHDGLEVGIRLESQSVSP